MEGKWELVVHTYMGDMRSHAEYHVEGNVLTGTIEDAANGAVAPIVNGKYEDGKFSYTLTIKTAVGEMTNELCGTVEGDSLSGKSKNPMGEFELTGTRA